MWLWSQLREWNCWMVICRCTSDPAPYRISRTPTSTPKLCKLCSSCTWTVNWLTARKSRNWWRFQHWSSSFCPKSFATVLLLWKDRDASVNYFPFVTLIVYGKDPIWVMWEVGRKYSCFGLGCNSPRSGSTSGSTDQGKKLKQPTLPVLDTNQSSEKRWDRPGIHKKNVHVPTSLRTAKCVFVRHSSHQNPLQRPHDGPFRVVERENKTFILELGTSGGDIVTINRLRRCH